MAHQPRQNHRTGQPAAWLRDRAMSRVRRLTAAITIAATAAAVGLGILVAADTTAHSASPTKVSAGSAASGTSATTTTPTTSGSSSSSSSSATTPTTAPTTTTTKPVTVSHQS